jgi:hypothetical protein
MNETQIEFMLGNVRQIWQRFFYRDTILLEAQRQKKLYTEEAPWSVEVSKLEDNDDVFATFIQVTAEKKDRVNFLHLPGLKLDDRVESRTFLFQ